MIDKVPHNINRVGSDINPYIIGLLIAVRDGWTPPTQVSKDFYDHVKKYPSLYPDEIVGFIGFGCSFGAKFFNGYARNSAGRNYANDTSKSLIKQSPQLQGLILKTCSYENSLDDVKGHAVIYCDPPYQNTTKYSHEINHDKFYNWCRERAVEGHTVFISEYSAPTDFKLVFEKSLICRLDKNSKKQRFERLYTI